MKERLKNMKIDFLLSSVFCILLGVILIIGRADVINVIGAVLAVMLIIIGLIDLGGYFLTIITGGLSILVGVVLVVLGIWFLMNPAALLSIIPVVIGILLIVHGIRAAQSAVESKKYGNSRWGLNLALAIVSIVLGVICAFDAFGVLENAVAVVGLILIYNGISNLWVAISGSRAKNEYRKVHGDDVIDVEFKD